MIEWTLNKSGTCRSYRDVPKGARVEAVNGRFVVGTCETCGKVVLEGHRYSTWADDIVTCAKCSGPQKERA